MRITVRRSSARQGDEAAPSLRRFDDFECDAVSGRCVGGSLAGIALVDPDQSDGIVGDGLYGPRGPFHLASILRAGRRDVARQQMTRCIDGHVRLRALVAFSTVVAGPLAALGRVPQRPAIDDRSGRPDLAPRRQTQHRAQIVDKRLEASRRQPALASARTPRPTAEGRRASTATPPPSSRRSEDR